MPETGKIAYDAYGEHRQWKTHDGSPMPTWENQSPDLRASWNVAATAVLRWASDFLTP